MKGIGIDCSSKAIHVAVIDDSTSAVRFYKSYSKSKDTQTRFLDIVIAFEKDLPTLIKGIGSTAVEKPIMIQNPLTTIAIAKVVAGVELALHRLGLSYCLVDNKIWKKDILNKGNASKDDIMEWAEKQWGDIFEEQDYADAACIALWGIKNNES